MVYFKTFFLSLQTYNFAVVIILIKVIYKQKN